MLRGLAIVLVAVGVSPAAGSPGEVRRGVIAFSCHWNVCAVRADGRDFRVLARTRADRHELAWSPAGAKLAFTVGSDLWVTDAQGLHTRRVAKSRAGFGDAVDVTWSPDGRQIAFVRELGPGIEIVNQDGSGRHVLVRAGGANVYEPAWSPNGAKLVYMRAGELFLADGNGSNAKRVTPHGQPYGASELPTWSPDGGLIAFVASKTSYPQNITVGAVCVMQADGTGIRRVSPRVTGDPTAPRWSPNAKLIAFACVQGKPAYHEMKRICVVRRDGSGFAKLGGPATAPEQFYPIPSWSPDGRWVAYGACARVCRIYITPASRGRARAVGRFPMYSDARSPVWRP